MTSVPADLIVRHAHASARIADALVTLRSLAGANVPALIDAIGHFDRVLGDRRSFAARLNAYRAIVAFDRGDVIAGAADTPAAAMLELQELQSGALRFDVARALAGVYSVRFHGARRVTGTNAMLAGPGMNRLSWRDDATLNVQCIPRPGAQTTAIAFCGFRHTFGIPVNVLYNVWLVSYPVNVIVVRDRDRVAYLDGVRSLGSMKESAAALRRMADAMGARRLVALGNSGGAGAAMRYGALMDADCALAFAPPTDFTFALTHVPPRTRERLVALRERIGAWPTVAEVLAGAPRMRADVFFGADHAVDREHAERLSTLPNAVLHPVSDVKSHDLVQALANRGELDAVFRDAFGGEGVN